MFFRRNDPITRLSGNSCDVPVGEPLCLFNSTGYLEIAISEEARKTLRPGSNVLAVTCRDTGGGRYIDVGLVQPKR